MKPALLVIDMQKAFAKGFGKESMDRAAQTINRAVKLFRENNFPVIWIQNEDKNGDLVPGSSGFDMVDSLLKPLDHEKRITKHYSNSFNKTDLLEYLIREKADTPIVTGYNSLYCVLSTYRGAVDQDLSPIILKNASASDNREYIKLVEDIHDIISINVLEQVIKVCVTIQA
ncbi:isochorismatase [Clostridia bacterium]|nr:isochorismatase [Clostridia bacterium]